MGNENWGCGGNMRPEHYSDVFRKYQTFIKNYGKNRIQKIACGANAGDLEWTDTLMREAAGFMDGLSLHYYTVTGDWAHKGSASEFDEETYYATLGKTLEMEKLVSAHSRIMDRYDPQKRVALVVDEWGTWFDVEQGTNPGFLYQQNTMRDALVAGINFNIFNRHSDRVRMANIAQLANVLQSVVLTEGPKMLLTPTYYAFELYKEHQGAVLADSFIETEPVGGTSVPNLHESVSLGKDGTLTSTVCNLSASEGYEVELTVFEKEIRTVQATILHNKIDARNTFAEPDAVHSESFDDFSLRGGKLRFRIPECSILALRLS